MKKITKFYLSLGEKIRKVLNFELPQFCNEMGDTGGAVCMLKKFQRCRSQGNSAVGEWRVGNGRGPANRSRPSICNHSFPTPLKIIDSTVK